MVQTFCLFMLLHCLDTDWAIRLLVGTYVDERLYEQALAELLRLPNTPENAEFIALYQAIIEGGLESSGKAATSAAIIYDIAENILSKNKSLAQCILAVYKEADYIRKGVPINLPNRVSDKSPSFKLMPNPAQDHVKVWFTKTVKPQQTLEIYNLQGQLVLTQKDIAQNALVNTTMLQTGMYFCRLSAEADVVKLVIVR